MSWRTDIQNAPKDGRDVLFPVELVVRAFWCHDQGRWVLSSPLHMDYVSAPTRFALALPDTDDRLIAEMLAALKMLVNETMFRDHPAASQAAVDAIAKAERRGG